MRRATSAEPLADLTRYIVEHLVDEPEAVTVSQTDDDGQAVIVIEVEDEDRGAVIGRQGRTIKAIEAVVRAAAAGGPVPVLEVADG
jgi:predicted RNA-binding protein YlqC (UPF0109 family)